jgi:hypothetical protein
VRSTSPISRSACKPAVAVFSFLSLSHAPPGVDVPSYDCSEFQETRSERVCFDQYQGQRLKSGSLLRRVEPGLNAMLLNLSALEEAKAATEPFPYLTASSVLRRPALDLLADDFPAITKPGIFALSDLHYGKVFEQLVKEIRGRELEALLEDKFDVTLADKPLMVTVRGKAQLKDGRIHADSKDKFLTCLLYLNSPHWNPEAGRLRLLRSPDNLDDIIAEVPPDGGTFIAFKRTDHSWHGHEPFEGVRRVVMFNWMVSKAALLKNLGRHTLSAAFKKFGGADAY